MSWLAIAVVAGSAISAAGSYASQRSSNKSRAATFTNAQNYLDSLRGRGDGFLTEAFGDSLNPEEFLYHAVDLSESQMNTIRGNADALPEAAALTKRVNKNIWKNDQKRINTLMPGFAASRDSYLGTMRDLQDGQLPFSDVADIVSGRAGASGVLNTPGGARNATLRDLGLSRMDATREGNSMFGQFVNIAQQISPVEHQMRPQQMFFTPQERASMDIQQAQLDMMGRSQAELARAMPDPAQNALINAEIGVNMASLGQASPSPWGGAMQAFGSGIASGAGMIAMAGGGGGAGASRGGSAWAQGAPAGAGAAGAPRYTQYYPVYSAANPNGPPPQGTQFNLQPYQQPNTMTYRT